MLGVTVTSVKVWDTNASTRISTCLRNDCVLHTKLIRIGNWCFSVCIGDCQTWFHDNYVGIWVTKNSKVKAMAQLTVTLNQYFLADFTGVEKPQKKIPVKPGSHSQQHMCCRCTPLHHRWFPKGLKVVLCVWTFSHSWTSFISLGEIWSGPKRCQAWGI